MRTEHEVNSAIDRYADMITRLCVVYLKNEAETERILKIIFLSYVRSNKTFCNPQKEKIWFVRRTITVCKLNRWWRNSHHISIQDMESLAPGITSDHFAVIQSVYLLPRKERIVVYLYFYEGYSITEISEILRTNQNVVYTTLQNAQSLLNESLCKNLRYPYSMV